MQTRVLACMVAIGLCAGAALSNAPLPEISPAGAMPVLQGALGADPWADEGGGGGGSDLARFHLKDVAGEAGLGGGEHFY
ncbi:hypothetical protein D3C78_1390190 [compost metagenome]